MPESLSQRTFRGLFWSSIERVGQQAVTFVVTMAVARLLTPENYGLIGMLSVFMALSAVMVDSGLGRALMEALLAEADARSLPEVHLTVLKDNVRACNLYESVDFLVVGETKFREENDSLCMVRRRVW